MAALTRSTRPLMKSEHELCRSNTETMIRDSMVGFYGIFCDLVVLHGFIVFNMEILWIFWDFIGFYRGFMRFNMVYWGSSGTFIAWSTKGFIIYQRDVTSKHDGYKLKTKCGKCRKAWEPEISFLKLWLRIDASFPYLNFCSPKKYLKTWVSISSLTNPIQPAWILVVDCLVFSEISILLSLPGFGIC